jgi:tetratricopeptide (TPR) repeat protein
VYDALVKRLQYPSPQMRGSAEIAYLLSRPEIILDEMAKLYEKRGQFEPALRAVEFVAQRQPEDLPAQVRVIRLLVTMGRGDDAVARAAQLVRKFHASSEALTELRATYHHLDRDAELVRELRALLTERPDDRAILFALGDALESAGRTRDAEALLERAIDDRSGDVEVVARLVQMMIARGQIPRAARTLVEASAANPRNATALESQWAALLSPGRNDALRVEAMRELDVSEGARAAKLYYLHHVMRAWSREMSARETLELSVRTAPPFAPAYRAMVNMIWASPPRATRDDRAEQTTALIDAARAAGQETLADEIRALMLLAQKQPEPAARLLARTAESKSPPPPVEALFALATAHRVAGNTGGFEQVSWRILSDHPHFADAHAALCKHYLDQGQLTAARRVLSLWRSNAPGDVNARLLDATLQLRVANAPQKAEEVLADLFRSSADDATVLANMRVFYSETNHGSRFIELLEKEVARRPHNYVAVAQLADVYASQDRPADAARVLDAVRDAMIHSRDVDRLYLVGGMYLRIDQKQQTERTLQDVLRIDPSFAPAGNDLGYTLADEGRDLDRAEALIRRAVAAEPNNPMFLDSLGWVLYKRGRFAEARQPLEQALVARRYDDPIVLDHLADTLYRLNLASEAAKLWQEASDKLGPASAGSAERDEAKTLRLQLGQKLKQFGASEPVTVAPVVEESVRPNQAKN